MTVEQDIENNRRHLDKNYFGVLGLEIKTLHKRI